VQVHWRLSSNEKEYEDKFLGLKLRMNSVQKTLENPSLLRKILKK
jgi:hypothetical protein